MNRVTNCGVEMAMTTHYIFHAGFTKSVNE